MIYNDEELESWSERIKVEMGFEGIMFNKHVNDDLYFIAWDEKGTKDRIRFRPSSGMLYTYFKGRWMQVQGFKFE